MFLKLRFRGDRALNNWKFTFFCGIHMVIDANISVVLRVDCTHSTFYYEPCNNSHHENSAVHI